MENAVVAPGQAALQSLRAQEPFAAILVYDASARAIALETALTGLQRLDTHVVRVCNPLRTPLTMERVLIQVAGFHTDLTMGEDTDTLMRTVIGHLQPGHKRLVVSVEQAETLHPLALILLDQIARPLEPGGQSPQILLTGTPAFTCILGHPLLDRMRAVLRMGTPDATLPPAEQLLVPAGAAMAPVPMPPVPMPVPTPVDRWSMPVAAEALNPASNDLAPANPVAEAAPVPIATRAMNAERALSRPLTAHQVRRAGSQSGGRFYLALLLIGIPVIITGGLYAAWQASLLPPGMNEVIAQWTMVIKAGADRSVAWVTATIAAVGTRLLPGASLF